MSLFQALLGALAISVAGVFLILGMIAFVVFWAIVDVYVCNQLGKFWRKRRPDTPTGRSLWRKRQVQNRNP